MKISDQISNALPMVRVTKDAATWSFCLGHTRVSKETGVMREGDLGKR